MNEWQQTIYEEYDEQTKSSKLWKFEDLKKTQEQIDAMTDDELEKLNAIVCSWTDRAIASIVSKIYTYKNCQMASYFFKRYKELKKQKIEHPMWRPKGAIECILLEGGLAIERFSVGFKVTCGNSKRDLLSIQWSFDSRDELRYIAYHRVYHKTNTLIKDSIEDKKKTTIEVWKKKQKQWYANRNKYSKDRMSTVEFGQIYSSSETNDYYIFLGCYPRAKSRPFRCHIFKADSSSSTEEALYEVSSSLMTSKSMKKLNKILTVEEYIDILYNNSKLKEIL